MNKQATSTKTRHQSLYNRPSSLSKWVFWGKEGTFPALLDGSVAYIRKVRAANRPVISVTVHTRGKYRFTLSMDMIEGFQHSRMSPTLEGLKLIEHWFADSTYRHRHYFSCGGPSYHFARFSNFDYVVKAANALSEIPLEYYSDRIYP